MPNVLLTSFHITKPRARFNNPAGERDRGLDISMRQRYIFVTIYRKTLSELFETLFSTVDYSNDKGKFQCIDTNTDIGASIRRTIGGTCPAASALAASIAIAGLMADRRAQLLA